MKQWSENNKEWITEYQRKYRNDNHERLISLNSDYYFSKRLELFQILSDDGVHVRCAQCSYDMDILALQVDHIDNTGYRDRKHFGGSTKTMCLYYIAHPEEAKKNLQILCANCNRLKMNNSVYGTSKDARRYSRIRLQLMRILSDDLPHCVYCGYNTSIHALEFDHINGGGLADFKRFHSNDKLYTYYALHPEEAKEKLQLLCVNCNRIKGSKLFEEDQQIPHVKDQTFFSLAQGINMISVT
jgi:5-methylcytosine-specific restriction endonuclease McrA